MAALTVYQMEVPRVRTKLDRSAFKCSAPSIWNDVQKEMYDNYKEQRKKLSVHFNILRIHFGRALLLLNPAQCHRTVDLCLYYEGW